MNARRIGTLRMVALLAIGVHGAAIALGTMAPRWEEHRLLSTKRLAVVDPVLQVGATGVAMMDPETGARSELPLAPGTGLDCVSVAPWSSGDGAGALVGRLSRRTGTGTGARFAETGLALISVPDGKELEVAWPESLPITAPVWYPGTRARVLFVAGDGRLHQFDFDSPDQGARPLKAPPELDATYFRELSWLDGPMARGVVLATAFQGEDEDSGHLPESRVWWLKLSPNGDAIERAGPLMAPSSGPDEVAPSERWPAIVARKDGGLALTYLWQPPNRRDCELRIVPLELDRVNHVPAADRQRSRVLLDHCLPNPTVTSFDGRWLVAVTRPGASPLPERLAVPDLPDEALAGEAVRDFANGLVHVALTFGLGAPKLQM